MTRRIRMLIVLAGAMAAAATGGCSGGNSNPDLPTNPDMKAPVYPEQKRGGPDVPVKKK
ncbi:MAG: hypothetical protein ACRCZF_03670 [Gemmataceae bacterium]